MTPEMQRRVEEVFLAVAERPPEEQDAALREHCGDDTTVYREVRSLLGFHEQADAFLNPKELQVTAAGFMGGKGMRDEALAPSRRVGDFTIKSVLGKGGMGIVYVAEQERPRRTVALKVIRGGFSTESLIRRFEHEAEVLGRLQHPGIAQIFEAGTFEDHGEARPYIAMELVPGMSLTKFVQVRQPRHMEILEIMAKVCDAVHHAHQRGVIHRDLKPGNILVVDGDLSTPAPADSDTSRISTYRTHAQPKILDFGVARATDADLRVTTMQTSVGQLIGTLPYMSPEQVLADPKEVDTRSDVYALGVILYQLLTGKLPHDLGSRSIPEAARVIRDEAPARLSSISKAFRGDVETIVGKALEKNKARRYQSAADMADDLRRTVRGEPILAKQDSAMYVLRKQLIRYKGLVAACGVAFAAIIGFAIYAGVQYSRYERLALEKGQLATSMKSLAEEKTLLADQKQTLAATVMDANSKLSAQLTAGAIERGRLMARAGNLSRSEELVWPILLADPANEQARWALWDIYSQHPQLASWRTENSQCTGLAISPDQKRIAVANDSGTVTLYDAASGNTIASVWLKNNGSSQDLVYLPDGRLVVAGMTRRLLVLDGETLSKLTSWSIYSMTASKLTLSADGATLYVSGSVDIQFGTPRNTIVPIQITQIDVSTGKVTDTLSFGRFGMFANAVSNDGRYLAGAIGDVPAGLVTFDLQERRVISIDRTVSGTVSSLQWHPDNVHLAAGSVSGEIRIWNVPTKTCERVLPSGNGTIRSLAFSEDGTQLTAGGWWSIDRWDWRSTSLLSRVGGGCSDLLLTNHGKEMITTSAMPPWSVKVWETTPGRARRSVKLPGQSPVGMAMNSEGTRLVTANADGLVQVWNTQQVTPLQSIKHNFALNALDARRDLSLIAAGDQHGEVVIWKPQTGEKSVVPVITRYPIFFLRFNASGSLLLASGYQGMAYLLNPDTMKLVASLTGKFDQIESAEFRTDDTIVALHRPRTVKLWNSDGECLSTFTIEAEAVRMALSPDQTKVAISTWDQTVEIWDIGTGKLEQRLTGFHQVVSCMDWNASMDRLLSTTADGRLYIHRPQDGVCLIDLPVESQSICRVLKTAADGSLASLAFADGTVSVWDIGYYNRHIEGNARFRRELWEQRAEIRRAPDMNLTLTRTR
ncbi:MAG: WD40 repeat domain-containing serine/threonine-protein kinase [Planctomycetota bacterium]|nr:WD40 repeat domain-containing serine/threonine-protein kinase [Planctomycetota bacterium]